MKPYNNSPSNMRGQCIDQLKKSHDLLDIGAITQSQYDELQMMIFFDVTIFISIKLFDHYTMLFDKSTKVSNHYMFNPS